MLALCLEIAKIAANRLKTSYGQRSKNKNMSIGKQAAMVMDAKETYLVKTMTKIQMIRRIMAMTGEKPIIIPDATPMPFPP